MTAQAFNLSCKPCRTFQKVREMLSQKWESDFVSYGIVRKPESSVSGSVFLLTTRNATQSVNGSLSVNGRIMFTSKQKYVFSELHFLSTQSQNIWASKMQRRGWTPLPHIPCAKRKILRVAREVWCNKTPPGGGVFLVPRLGIEPRFTASKAAVLPLDDLGGVIFVVPKIAAFCAFVQL